MHTPHRVESPLQAASLAWSLLAAILLTTSLCAKEAIPASDPGACDASAAGSLVAKIRSIPSWFLPAEPVHIAGPVYFVGTAGLGVWLIRTTDGDILMNTGGPGSGPYILQSIRKVAGADWQPSRIKLLLACHAHVDHVGALAWIQRETHAPVKIMDREAHLLSSGGRCDFSPLMRNLIRYPAVQRPRVLADGETITHGGVTLTALRTAGHTRGATTFVLHTTEAGRPLTIVFPDGTGINPGTRFCETPSYTGIRADYERTFKVLSKLKPDIWLTPHLEVCGFARKRKLAQKAKTPTARLAAWIDPQGYQVFLCNERNLFNAALRKESQAHQNIAKNP